VYNVICIFGYVYNVICIFGYVYNVIYIFGYVYNVIYILGYVYNVIYIFGYVYNVIYIFGYVYNVIYIFSMCSASNIEYTISKIQFNPYICLSQRLGTQGQQRPFHLPIQGNCGDDTET
jgi:hypothetical protein